MNETQTRESDSIHEFFLKNKISREFRLPCALVLRATPAEYDQLVTSIAKNFPQIILVKGRMTTDRIWIMTDSELEEARQPK